MKKYLLILCGAFFLHISQSSAQENKPTREVKKGYYAIGNNASKLARPLTINLVKTGTTTPQKGYYTIGNNQNKLETTPEVVTPQTPVIQKGYYKIGNNADKLRR
ncbi:hypothetical protein [Filimonas effusa]|uniref:Uncharacterized protein n=1 Tax=Filimonas effusa TaxID=2508721 RepID=A0A4Q1CZY4_9BACT|nr:hypothetical protein [Filimonas effusa]RXK80963.1 hypothetical protein ESB13_22685 [Filimonas effusa]